MAHHSEILDLTETRKEKEAINRRNYKHGMRSMNPALLIGEESEQFELIHQGLVDYYKPENPILVNDCIVAAMCMLKQRRVWAAESAMAIEASPPPEAPKPPEKPWESVELSKLDTRGIDHPETIRAELRVLKKYITLINNFPLYSRSKYWEMQWDDWMEMAYTVNRYAEDNYPICRALESSYQLTNRDDGAVSHPWTEIVGFSSALALSNGQDPNFTWYSAPHSKAEYNSRKQYVEVMLASFTAEHDRLTGILDEREQAEQQYQKDLDAYNLAMKERERAIASPITDRAVTILKYAAFNDYQLNGAINRLEQALYRREHGVSEMPRGRNKPAVTVPAIAVNAS